MCRDPIAIHDLPAEPSAIDAVESALADVDVGRVELDIILVAERQRKHIETMPAPHPRLSKVTVSIGAAAFDPRDQEEGTEQLLRRADLALYRAKHAGRNRVVMATDAEAEPDSGVGRAESGMRQAHRASSQAPMAKGVGR